MMHSLSNFFIFSPSELFYFLLPLFSAVYLFLFSRDIINKNFIKVILQRIAIYFVFAIFIHIYLSSIMQGKIIWKEVIIYFYFFSSVSIILFMMKALFKKVASRISKRVSNLRFQKPVHFTVTAVLWTFILLPYVLATFTLHRPKVGDRYNPKSVYMFDYENVSLRTQDGLILKGWFIPKAKSNKAVVVGHGLGANKSNFLGLVNLWHGLDYNVLIFDFRGHGESGGHTISFGYKEKYDMQAGFDYLTQERKFYAKDVIGYGVSFGGASLIQAVSNGTNFERIITDSSFASIDTMAKKTVERMGFVPTFLRESIKNLGLAFVSLELGFDVNDASPLRIIDKIKVPWLIIHGKNDVLIPSQEALDLYHNVNTKKQLYLIDSGEHYTTIEDTQYTKRLVHFLNDDSSVALKRESRGKRYE